MRAFSIQVSSVLAIVCGVVGCGAESPDSGEGNNGVLTFAMTNAPPEARCAVLTIETDVTTTKTFSLVPTEPAVFTVNDLPTGDVTLSEQVYTVACSSIAGKTPQWVSDEVEVTLEVGTPVDVTFSLHVAATAASVTIHTDFPDAVLPVTEYGLSSNPYDLESGPDDNIWYLLYNGTKYGVGRLTTSGVASEFTPSFSFSPMGFTAGPDGNLWLTSYGASTTEIVRLTTSGVFTQMSFLASATTSMITTGADGNLWLTEYSSNKVAKVTTSGMVTEYSVPTASGGPYFITAGADGNVWFGEYNSNKIGRITPSGTITEFGIPTANAYPGALTAGSDGNVWFVEYGATKVGRITPGGTIKEFAVSSYASRIAGASDGNVWLMNSTSLTRVTTAGVAKEFAVPSGAYLNGMTAGPDGDLWFSEWSPKKIGRLDLSAL